ncbi:MAG: aminotransferase class V-fold PLP-dependent enzyme [Micrococcales bacterium]|nr:aminotransferase class V-fold PLP-dependent enzyme [Micrococcales bacterium]
MRVTDWLVPAAQAIEAWQDRFGPFTPHPSLDVADGDIEGALGRLTERLTDNYPFFHPRYAGQMLKPPHPAAVVGYLAAMLINPNNHALDGGPATAAMEKEVVADLARMLGLPQHLGHLTTSGTIANLEALFVARELHPGKAVAHSADAHYTHARMCHVLGVESVAVPTDSAGRIRLDELDRLLATGRIGTVVATAGTTGMGCLDEVHDIVPMARRHGVRVHVDAAYGGFFGLIADDSADGVAAAPFAAIGSADSVVIDPHKHGLQPYGCGAVLFADPAVGQLYSHDSPYTYFTSDELHLGEISLECSRSGAAAAALWLTTQVLPLTPDGLGAVLRPGRRAALDWVETMPRDVLQPFMAPELDIVGYVPAGTSLSQIDRVSAEVMDRAMHLPPDEAVFVATYAVRADQLRGLDFQPTADTDTVRILRSVMMKPESEGWTGRNLETLARLTREALSA